MLEHLPINFLNYLNWATEYLKVILERDIEEENNRTKGRKFKQKTI